jgi:glycine oxidase
MKIVILGAGVAGLSVGWRLAEAGCTVVVLERARPGRGATWAAGGMLAPGAEHGDADAAEATLAARSAAMWPEFAAAIEARSGQSVSYRRDGSLIAATSQAERDALAAHPAKGTEMLDADAARRLEPLLAPDIAGALYAPDDAQVDNRALGLALALAFVKAGGVLQVNEAVVSLEVARGRVLGARTPFALHEADAFVIAAGAWSGEIKGLPADALPPVVPVKGEMIALKPVRDALPTRLVWGHGAYLIPRHDRLFIGATVSREGFDTSLSRAAEDWLLTRACALMPALKDWPVAEHWAGLRPGSPDDLPIVGETTIANLYAATGQYRNGILFAPAIADALHRLIVERRPLPEMAAFDPKRFTAQALAAGSGVR